MRDAILAYRAGTTPTAPRSEPSLRPENANGVPEPPSLPDRDPRPAGARRWAVRIERPDDYRPLTREVARLQGDAVDLAAEQEALEADLKETLGRDEAEFSEGEARILKRELAELEERQALVAARIEAKRAQLPTDKDRKAAEKTARELVAKVEGGNASFRSAWDLLRRGSGQSRGAAVAVSAAKAEAREPRLQLEDLVARFGLDVAVPASAEVPDAKVAWLVGMLVAQTAVGEPDDVVIRDLNAARRKQAS